MNKVIVDTSVWIEYFRKSQNTDYIIDNLIDSSRIIILGPIVAELIQGVKDKKEAELLKEYIGAIPYEEYDFNDWVNAGTLSNKLCKSGITIPLTDILIAVLSIRCNAMIYTYDRHFNAIPDIKLFQKCVES